MNKLFICSSGVIVSLISLHPSTLRCSDTWCPPSSHPDGSRSRPSRWRRISAWRSTRAWPRGLGFGRSCGLPGLGPGTAACSLGSLSTSGRGSLSPCEKLSHCSSPVQRSLLNSGGELQANTSTQSALQSLLFRWWNKKHTLYTSVSTQWTHVRLSFPTSMFTGMQQTCRTFRRNGPALRTYRILFWIFVITVRTSWIFWHIHLNHILFVVEALMCPDGPPARMLQENKSPVKDVVVLVSVHPKPNSS